MRPLFVLCLLAGSAHAELPTIDSEHPPTLRIAPNDWDAWSVKIERVGVEVRSAPEVTFVTIVVTGRERTIQLPIDVPSGTKLVGLGVDAPEGRAWGRPMPLHHARDRQRSNGGSVLHWSGTSAEHDHLTIHVNVPATVELALHLPPLPRLAIATSAGLLAVAVGGEKVPTKHKRVVVELADIAGTSGEIEMPHVTSTVALVAAPTTTTDFFPQPPSTQFGSRSMVRDLDKAMIRRRMKWFRPGLRECFMRAARSSNVRAGGAVVTFMILADGSVESAKTSESDLPAPVNECLVEQVESWEFPATDGNVLVHYPLTFHANEF